MARWELKTDYEKGEVTLTYTGKNKQVQDCGRCEVALKSQLLDWMFSPGQVDAFDVVIIDGRECFCSTYVRRVWA